MRGSLEDRVAEGQDIIDPRDVRERIQELEDETAPPELECVCHSREDGEGGTGVPPSTSTCGECGFAWCDRCEPCPSARTPCEESHEGREELKALRALAEEMSEDEALIADHYFEDHARDLAEELHGALSTEWPYTAINWKQATEELQQDYNSIRYGSTDYWQRC